MTILILCFCSIICAVLFTWLNDIISSRPYIEDYYKRERQHNIDSVGIVVFGIPGLPALLVYGALLLFLKYSIMCLTKPADKEF